jgi:hypothetical protein
MSKNGNAFLSSTKKNDNKACHDFANSTMKSRRVLRNKMNV